jgi:HD superfamily phosphohydrolase
MPSDRFDEVHKVRDPIHGFIRYNDLERDIINSAPFQRLRRIRQLGPVSFVYPGAEHSRFQHSIGVMHTASRVFDLVAGRSKERLGWSNEDLIKNRQLLRLASLLHDVGHPPFSHVSEDLLPDGKSHEEYSRMIVNSSPVRELIETDCGPIGFGAEAVGDLIKRNLILPGTAFLNEILGGDIDADRMDYLLRDSLFCGVGYGKYDLEILLHTLTLRLDPDAGNWVMAIQDDGVQAAEGLILARYFMFTQVYFHSVARVYQHHLVKFLKETVLPGGHYPADVPNYLVWDDVKVLAAMTEASKVGNAQASRMADRNLFRPVVSTSNHIDEAEDVQWRTLIDAFQKAFARMEHFEDVSTRAPHGFEKAEFHVVVSPSETMPIIRRSGVVGALKLILKRRLYVDRANEPAAKRFCEEHKAKHRAQGARLDIRTDVR